MKRGFTLIELLVVIAIIGILATLVVTQLGGAQTRARNSTAKSDVTNMGKAIETWKTNGSNENVAISYATTSLAGTTNTGAFITYFNGNASPTAIGYPIAITRTPSSSHTYRYATSGTAITTGPGAGDFTAPGAANYCIATSVVTGTGGVTDTAFFVNNGSSGSGTAATATFTSGVCS